VFLLRLPLVIDYFAIRGGPIQVYCLDSDSHRRRHVT
jgi:hypothetical protein